MMEIGEENTMEGAKSATSEIAGNEQTSFNFRTEMMAQTTTQHEKTGAGECGVLKFKESQLSFILHSSITEGLMSVIK